MRNTLVSHWWGYVCNESSDMCLNCIAVMSNSGETNSWGMMMIILVGLLFLLSRASATDSAVFERYSSSMPIPVPISTVQMDSEVGCAISCSRNVLCEFYHFDTIDWMCSQYQAPEWSRNVVYPDASSDLSFKGRVWRCGKNVGNLLWYTFYLYIFYTYGIFYWLIPCAAICWHIWLESYETIRNY